MQRHIHKIKIQVRISWTSMLYTTINVVYNHVVLYLDWQWKLHNEQHVCMHIKRTSYLWTHAQHKRRFVSSFNFVSNRWTHCWTTDFTGEIKIPPFNKASNGWKRNWKKTQRLLFEVGWRRYRYIYDQIMWLESNHRAPINKSYYSSNFHPPS